MVRKRQYIIEGNHSNQDFDGQRRTIDSSRTIVDRIPALVVTVELTPDIDSFLALQTDVTP